MSTSSDERSGRDGAALFSSRGEEETEALGRALGERLPPGSIVALVGPLGAGKTRFVRGLADGLGVADLDAVRSPTYVLHHVYRARRGALHHVDAYRLSGAAEYEALDVAGVMAPGDCLAVEWADRIDSALPSGAIRIEIAFPDDPSHEPGRREIRTPAGGIAAAAFSRP